MSAPEPKQADAAAPCSWISSWGLDDSLALLRELASDHLSECPVYGHSVLTLLRESKWSELVDFQIDYDRISVNEALNLRQALGFFQKLGELPLGRDLKTEAWSKFLESERACKQTNDLFRMWTRGSISFRPRDVVRMFLARQKIARVLGSPPSWADLQMRHGPGATVRTKKSNASWQRKFATGMSCSAELFHSGHLPSVFRELPHWTAAFMSWYICDEGWLCGSVPVEVDTGRLQFVPKSAKSLRSIVVEPVLNVFIQQGLLQWMERRLYRAGINLRDQSINKDRARVGSIDGSVATIDLSSASDTVSIELVRFLLPPEWFDILSSTRTGVVVYGDVPVTLEKFSSMGNSYTFPLESLIFWALCTTIDTSTTVYGDDIVCKTEHYADIAELLSLCGFSVNMEKSFWDGPFRESCGGDYLKGIDIRPYYQKHLVSGQTLFSLHNFYMRNREPERAKKVLEKIPEPIRLFGPDGYGDGHLIGHSWTPRISPRLLKKGYGGVSFDTFCTSARCEPSLFPGDWITPLYCVYQRSAEEPSELDFTKSGRPLWPLPGADSYVRKSIYTFERP